RMNADAGKIWFGFRFFAMESSALPSARTGAGEEPPPAIAVIVPVTANAPAVRTTATAAATPTASHSLSRPRLRWRSSRCRALWRPSLPARMVDLFDGERDMSTPNARPAVPTTGAVNTPHRPRFGAGRDCPPRLE